MPRTARASVSLNLWTLSERSWSCPVSGWPPSRLAKKSVSKIGFASSHAHLWATRTASSLRLPELASR